MFSIVLHTFLAILYIIHIHALNFFFRNGANFKPVTLSPVQGCMCKPQGDHTV
jgi:hypothetical protein